jgi:hypothetical protein
MDLLNAGQSRGKILQWGSEFWTSLLFKGLILVGTVDLKKQTILVCTEQLSKNPLRVTVLYIKCYKTIFFV